MMYVDACLANEYACFVDTNCRQCFAAVRAAASVDDDNNNTSDTKADALRSPACTATNPTMLIDLTNTCGGQTFPACTFYKQQCTSSPECASCLAALLARDGAGAARQCPGTQPSGFALDTVVDNCVGKDAAACDFWRQRCANNGHCGGCLASMDTTTGDDGVRAIAADWSTPTCQRATNDFFALSLSLAVAHWCTGISSCRNAITNCGFAHGAACVACFNGSSSSPTQATFCSELSQQFSLDAFCQPCPASVHTINSVVFATATVGGASAAACLSVAATIVAHGRDRVSMRDRVVVGLMLANAVYSTANAIPLNALHTDLLDCGRHAMSFDAIRFGRAWWFCGKYGLVGFELLILGASIRALHHGMSAVPRRAELAMHAACCTLAAAAFAVFYALCTRINTNGYNESTETKVYTNAYNHASPNDDLDDDEPSLHASSRYMSARDAYDNLVRDMLVVWDVVVAVAVGLWIALRALHQHALRALRTEAAAAARAEANDEWAETRAQRVG
jgi:hypothetical protein